MDNRKTIGIMINGLVAYLLLVGFTYFMPVKLLFYWILTGVFIIGVLFINENWRRSQGEKIGSIGELLSAMIQDFGYAPVQFVILTSFIWLAPVGIISWFYFLAEWIVQEVKKINNRRSNGKR